MNNSVRILGFGTQFFHHKITGSMFVLISILLNHSLFLVSKGPGNPTSFLCGCASHATRGTYLGRPRTGWKGVECAGASVTPTYQKCWCETCSRTKRTNESMILKFDLQCSIFSDVFSVVEVWKIGDNRRHNDRMFIPTFHDFHDFHVKGWLLSFICVGGTGTSAGSRSGRWDIQRLGSCRASLEWNYDPRWLGTLDLERNFSELVSDEGSFLRWFLVDINLDVRGKHVWNIFGIEMMYFLPTEVEAHPHWAPVSSTISEWCNVLRFSRSPLKITNVFPKTSKDYSLLEYSTETGCIRWTIWDMIHFTTERYGAHAMFIQGGRVQDNENLIFGDRKMMITSWDLRWWDWFEFKTYWGAMYWRVHLRIHSLTRRCFPPRKTHDSCAARILRMQKPPKSSWKVAWLHSCRFEVWEEGLLKGIGVSVQFIILYSNYCKRFV